MLRTWLVLVFAILWGCSKQAPDAGGASLKDAPQAEQAKELIFNTYLPSGDAMRRVAVEDFGKRIEKESQGALKVTIPDSTLAPSNRQWAVVTEGVADLAVIATYSQRAQLALPLIADLPFNSLTAEAASVALWNTQQKYFDRLNEFADVQLLSMYALPPLNFVSNVKPVNKIEDFKGLKIWVAAGAPTEAVKAVGGIPVYSPFPQLFEYASKGNIDALMVGIGTVKQAGIGEYVKYMTRIPGGMGSASFAVVMNKNTWKGLSDAQRAAVLRAAQDLPRRAGQALDQRNRDALQEIKLTINDADPTLLTELHRQLAPIEASWIESTRQRGLTNAAEALKFYRDQMAAIAAQSAQSN